MASARVWIEATRPKTLPAALAPVAAGVAIAVARDRFAPGPAAAALGGALALQIAANFANDLFDHVKGADTKDRLGPVRAVAAGLIPPRAMRTATILALAVAFGLGVYLVAVGGWPVVAIGLSAMVCAVAYTGGPYPLAYHGLGEVFAWLFFGPVAVAGTVYVQSRAWDSSALLVGAGLGLLCANILTVNNLRDIETDRAAGKRTLATRIGRERTILQIRALTAGGLILVGAAAVRNGWWCALMATLLAAVVFGPKVARGVGEARGRALNPVLGATARFEAQVGLAFAVGLLADRLI